MGLALIAPLGAIRYSQFMMQVATPIILTGPGQPIRVSLAGRCIAAAAAATCLAVLLTAAWLPPDPAGLATHRQLGMPTCGFLERTGLPCISCGMTTSFAWFVRGNLAASLYVQPMGAVLALFTCASVWIGLYVACTGRAIHRTLERLNDRYTFMALAALAIAAWGWKIFIHLHGLDGWR